MKNSKASRPATRRSFDSAFVVHLAQSAAEEMRGRIEHVASGNSLRFDSVADMVIFMRRARASVTGKTLLAAVLSTVIGILAFGPQAAAADQQLAGRKLVLKNNARGASLNHIAKDETIAFGASGGSGDPRCSGANGGGTSSIRIIPANGAEVTVLLPCAGWTADASGTTYKYKDRSGTSCSSVQVKRGKLLKATCKGSQVAVALAPTIAPVAVVTTLNTEQYCTAFGGTVVKDGSDGTIFAHKDALPPDACPARATATRSLTPTIAATQTPTEIPTEAGTPTRTPTEVPTGTPSDTPTGVPTDTPTEVPTRTPTNTPTITATPSVTATPTPAPCNDPNQPIDFVVNHWRVQSQNKPTPAPVSTHVKNPGSNYLDPASTDIAMDNFENHLAVVLGDIGCTSEYMYAWRIETIGGDPDYTANGITGYLTRELILKKDSLPDLWNNVIHLKVKRLNGRRIEEVMLEKFAINSQLDLDMAYTCHYEPSSCPVYFANVARPTTEPHEWPFDPNDVP